MNEKIIQGKIISKDHIKGKIYTNIKQLINADTSDATAIASDILSNKTAYANNNKITGTMPNNGAISKTLDTSTTSYTVPKGYHNGSGIVKIINEEKTVTPNISSQIITPTSGKVLSKVEVSAIPSNYIDTSDANATASQILSNKTAYVNGSKITGSMTNNGAVTKTLDTSTTSYKIPSGYHNGNGVVNIITETKSVTPTKSSQNITPTSGKILGSINVGAIPDQYVDTSDANATASNIQSGKTAYVNGIKITGTHVEETNLDTSDATAVASDILSNKTAYVNGEKLTGTMSNNGTVNKTLDTSTISYTIPKGYHSGSGKINITTEAKTVTPSTSEQTITPTSGKVLSSVSVNAIPSNYVDSSDATANASDIANGKTAYVNGNKITGTHICDSVNLQSKSVTPSETAQTVSPDSGYDGLSSVSVGAISNTYIGSKVTKKSAATYTPNTSDQTIASGQYLSGTQTIKGDSNLIASNIKSGISIFGINGTYAPSLQAKTVTPTKSNQTISPDTNYDGLSSVVVNAIPSNYVDSSDATTTAQDMAYGKTAYVNGSKVTGVAKTVTSYTGYRDITPQMNSFSDTNYICLNSPDMDSSGILFKEGSHFYLGALPSAFGNATASDVAKGKTFTSAAGLVVTGTHECSSSLPDTIIAGDTPVVSSSLMVKTISETTITATGIKVTVPKSGTYRFKFSCGRTNTSGDWTTQLYKNGTAISDAIAVWTNYEGYCTSDVSCSSGDEIEIYAMSRSSLYKNIVGQLIACIDWSIT